MVHSLSILPCQLSITFVRPIKLTLKSEDNMELALSKKIKKGNDKKKRKETEGMLTRRKRTTKQISRTMEQHIKYTECLT
jgi:hypothetical protein